MSNSEGLGSEVIAKDEPLDDVQKMELVVIKQEEVIYDPLTAEEEQPPEIPGRYEINAYKDSSAKPYACDLCDYKGSWKSDLAVHMTTHTGVKPYACDLCDYKGSRKSDVAVHMTTHTGEKPYSCEICGHQTSTSSHLARHIKTHTGDKPFTCGLCDYRVSRHSDLAVHMRTHTGEKPYACDVCDYKAGSRTHLTRHMRTHTGEKPFSCDICGFSTSRRPALESHVRNHTGEKPFTCKICDYATSLSTNLKKHMISHSSVKPYVCDLCEYSTGHQSHLKRHRKIHLDEKPYACTVCNFKTIQHSNLLLHMSTHTLENSFACDSCHFKCANRSDLIKHLVTHTGEQLYPCDSCDYVARQLPNLIGHQKTHSDEKPFSCDFCDYKTRKASTLKMHVRNHTGEKPFSCELCDYTAIKRSYLITHRRIHTGEKPYKCNDCDYATARRWHLLRHVKSHEGGNAEVPLFVGCFTVLSLPALLTQTSCIESSSMTPKTTQMDMRLTHRRDDAPKFTSEKPQLESNAKLRNPNPPYKWTFVWSTLLTFAYIHAVFPYGLYLWFARVKWATHIFVWVSIYIGGLGITAGAHRLWAHKSYRARAPLRIMLALFNASAFERSIYDWVRDHRSHHRYTDTNADPYNAQRGFFFSHMGWLLIKKHPDVVEKGKLIDMSDLEKDWVVMFQKKYYAIIMPICVAILPATIPVYLWGEDPWNAWIVCSVTRWCYMLHSTWTVNSLAHIWGNKPYDKSISPAQNFFVAICAFGEGWHNYHHAFPWDYRTSEFSSWELNWTSAFIDTCAKIGWAYNLKTANVEMIEKRIRSTGDGSHHLYQHPHIEGNAWGWDDKELSDEDRAMALILYSRTR